MQARARLLLGLALVIGACGNGEGSTVDSPCDLADAESITSIFGGSVSEGVEGEFRDCEFAIEGGPVFSVSVYDYGGTDLWESTRAGYEENRGGVTMVEGIGDDAFFPNDTGARELVVRSGGQIFAVSVFIGFDEPTAEMINAVADLAKAIADDRA